MKNFVVPCHAELVSASLQDRLVSASRFLEPETILKIVQLNSFILVFTIFLDNIVIKI